MSTSMRSMVIFVEVLLAKRVRRVHGQVGTSMDVRYLAIHARICRTMYEELGDILVR